MKAVDAADAVAALHIVAGKGAEGAADGVGVLRAADLAPVVPPHKALLPAILTTN